MLQEPHSKLSKVSQTFHSHVESFEQSQGGLVIHRLNFDWEGSKGDRQSRKKWRLIKLSELGKKLCKYEFCVHKIKWLSHLSNRASKKSAEFFLDLNLTCGEQALKPVPLSDTSLITSSHIVYVMSTGFSDGKGRLKKYIFWSSGSYNYTCDHFVVK